MKTVVTLTTIPVRLSNPHEEALKSCILSLLNQDYSGDYEVHLNVPKVHKITSEPYIIPDYLQELANNNNKLKIYSVEEDKGTLTKLFYTLQRITDPDTIIIVCDDDLVYHPNMIEEQVKNQEKYPDTAVGYDGIRVDREDYQQELFNDIRDHYVVSVYRNVYVSILQHYKTVSYKRKFFGDDYEEFVKLGTWNDDIIHSAYMSKRKIKKMITFYEHEEKLITEEQWKEKGGVTTFPVLKHTNHSHEEGCNLIRREQKDDAFYFFHNLGFLK